MKNMDGSKPIAQGDLIMFPVKSLPEGVIPMDEDGNKYVVAHSETGHNHVIEKTHVKAFVLKKPDIYQMFLQVDEPAALVHEKSFDKHETVMIPPGTYQINRQREYTPEGYRRAAD